MKDEPTTKVLPDPTSQTDDEWSRFDAMTEEERHRAALLDPDNQPLTDADMARMKRTPQVKIIRRALRLSSEEFSSRYRIPLSTLNDWEAGAVEPDETARAYLRAIAGDPEAVEKALRRKVG